MGVRSLADLAGSALVVSLAGCASVTGSSTQPIVVNAVCEGELVRDAACTLSNDKGRWTMQTPGAVTVSKSYGDLAIECRRDQAVGAATFQSKNNGGVWGNVIAGGLIGYAVDSKTGAGFDYPPSVTLVLAPPCPKSPNPNGEAK
jgi:hypothetical protein